MSGSVVQSADSVGPQADIVEGLLFDFSKASHPLTKETLWPVFVEALEDLIAGIRRQCGENAALNGENTP